MAHNIIHKLKHLQEQLKNSGFITCPHPACGIMFHRANDIEKHYLQCTGKSNNSTVTCIHCNSLILSHQIDLHNWIMHNKRNSVTHVGENKGQYLYLHRSNISPTQPASRFISHFNSNESTESVAKNSCVFIDDKKISTPLVSSQSSSSNDYIISKRSNQVGNEINYVSESQSRHYGGEYKNELDQSFSSQTHFYPIENFSDELQEPIENVQSRSASVSSDPSLVDKFLPPYKSRRKIYESRPRSSLLYRNNSEKLSSSECDFVGYRRRDNYYLINENLSNNQFFAYRQKDDLSSTTYEEIDLTSPSQESANSSQRTTKSNRRARMMITPDRSGYESDESDDVVSDKVKIYQPNMFSDGEDQSEHSENESHVSYVNRHYLSSKHNDFEDQPSTSYTPPFNRYIPDVQTQNNFTHNAPTSDSTFVYKKKFELAEKEERLRKAERLVKLQEEIARERIWQALNKQQNALNEREKNLKKRELLAQKKLEEASRLLQETQKIKQNGCVSKAPPRFHRIEKLPVSLSECRKFSTSSSELFTDERDKSINNRDKINNNRVIVEPDIKIIKLSNRGRRPMKINCPLDLAEPMPSIEPSKILRTYSRLSKKRTDSSNDEVLNKNSSVCKSGTEDKMKYSGKEDNMTRIIKNQNDTIIITQQPKISDKPHSLNLSNRKLKCIYSNYQDKSLELPLRVDRYIDSPSPHSGSSDVSVSIIEKVEKLTSSCSKRVHPNKCDLQIDEQPCMDHNIVPEIHVYNEPDNHNLIEPSYDNSSFSQTNIFEENEPSQDKPVAVKSLSQFNNSIIVNTNLDYVDKDNNTALSGGDLTLKCTLNAPGTITQNNQVILLPVNNIRAGDMSKVYSQINTTTSSTTDETSFIKEEPSAKNNIEQCVQFSNFLVTENTSLMLDKNVASENLISSEIENLDPVVENVEMCDKSISTNIKAQSPQIKRVLDAIVSPTLYSQDRKILCKSFENVLLPEISVITSPAKPNVINFDDLKDTKQLIAKQFLCNENSVQIIPATSLTEAKVLAKNLMEHNLKSVPVYSNQIFYSPNVETNSQVTTTLPLEHQSVNPLSIDMEEAKNISNLGGVSDLSKHDINESNLNDSHTTNDDLVGSEIQCEDITRNLDSSANCEDSLDTVPSLGESCYDNEAINILDSSIVYNDDDSNLKNKDELPGRLYSNEDSIGQCEDTSEDVPPKVKDLVWRSKCGRKVKLKDWWSGVVGETPKPVLNQNLDTNMTTCPSAKPKRGRKRKHKVISENLNVSEPLECNQSSKIETPPQMKANDGDKFICGKCDEIFNSDHKYLFHSYKVHNGLSRLKGESQMFYMDEAQQHINEAYRKMKIYFDKENLPYTTTCEECGKIFKTYLGFKYHITNVCTKNIKLQNCIIPDENNDCNKKRQRKAAKRCQDHLRTLKIEEDNTDMDIKKHFLFIGNDQNILIKKFNDRLKISKTAPCINEGCDLHFTDSQKLKIHLKVCSGSYVKFLCKICDFVTSTKEIIINHINSTHSDNLNESDFSSSSEEDFDDNEDEIELKLPKRCVKNLLFAPAVEMTKNFRKNNFSQYLFPNMKCIISDWMDSRCIDHEMYLPSLEKSPHYKLGHSDENFDSISWRQIPRFHSDIHDSNKIIFAGGHVQSAQWCPIPGDKKGNQFIALCSHKNPDEIYPINKSVKYEGVIQLWNCHKLAIESVPKLCLLIAHNFGIGWDMEWCPSGIYESDSNESHCYRRLGLLGCSFSDGSIRIFVIPNPKDLQILGESLPLYKKNPDLSLLPGVDKTNLQCTKLSWCSSKGHSLVAGCFTDGVVCIWNLSESLEILRECDEYGDTIIYPTLSIKAHQGPCSTVSFCPSTEGNHIVTGGIDRIFRFWDLSQPDHPLAVIRKGIVTKSEWPTHWAGAYCSFDDCFNLQKCSTSFRENGFFGSTYRFLMGANSTVKDISSSEWFNAVAQVSEAGEVMVMFHQSLLCENMGNEKHMNKKIYPLFTVVLDNLKTGERLSLKKEYGCNENSDSHNDKLEELNFVQKEIKPQKLNIYPNDFKSATQEFGVTFIEEKYDRHKKPKTKSAHLMEPGPLTVYPLMGASCVSWNNNFGHHSWIFVGLNSGFGRIIQFPLSK